MTEQNLSLAQAAIQFLASLPPQARDESHQEVNRFIRWYGMERPLGELSAHEVANYAARMEGSSANVVKRLEPVKAFLAYAKKEGLTTTNLAAHLKLKKGPPKQTASIRRSQRVALTAQGHQELGAELVALKAERTNIAEEIRRAAADKDFRENAPLDAAKDHQGKVEARIRELTEILKSGIVAADEINTAQADLGCMVILRDLSSNEELRYTLVHPSEVDPAKGKISVASPTGKALLDRGKGEVVEVAAPIGKIRYRIEGIESQLPLAES